MEKANTYVWPVVVAMLVGLLQPLATDAQVRRPYRLPQEFDRKYMAPDMIVVKLRQSGESSSDGRIDANVLSPLQKVVRAVQAVEVDRPFASPGKSEARTKDPFNLANIYRLRIPEDADVIRYVNRLLLLPEVEYAEPYFLNELLYVPNDPQAAPGAGQDNLPVIQAHEAWNTTVGDSNIVIGIVDTGVKMAHEDLDNVAVNIYDPINGVDDDQDGYIDNYYGWDLADNDNNPDADGPGHGTKVAGISSARANNGIAMAGVGLRSKYMPVKVAETSSGLLVNSYEGIIYAAQHGCKVINLSWGGVYPYFQYGQDVINQVVLTYDAVVVAAAGNTTGDLDFYPASFDNVISVGATDMGDNRASWATYSYHIDVMAPGQAVYTTSNNGGYERGWGTSYSTPQVAGAAALVRSRFPTLNAQQVTEQIRVSSDDIYAVGSNMNYYGQLGKGRLNVERAVAGINSPAVRQTAYAYATGFDQYIFSGDTLIIEGAFKNYLGPAQKVTVTLSSPTENVFFDNNAYYLGNMGTGDEGSNNGDPFIVRLGDAVKPGERVVFRLDYEGENYTDFQHFTMTTTPDYFPVTNREALLTITSDGDLGFNRDSLREGYGIAYKQKLVAYWSGLILAKDSNHVSDNVVNNFGVYTREQDFQSLKYARLYKNSQADVDGRSVFEERDALANKIGVRMEQKILSWDRTPDHDFFVVEYRLTNTTDSTLHGVDLGLFSDWELSETGNDAAGWDAENRMGFAYDKQFQNLYAGLALLSDANPAHYSIDLLDRNGNTAELDSLFSDSRKHSFLSGGVQKENAGTQGEGNDVAQLTGYNDIVMLAGESRKLAFVMLFGTSLEHLRNDLENARSLYQDYLSKPPYGETFYTCLGDSAVIAPTNGSSFELYADPYMEDLLDSGTVFITPPVYNDKDYYLVVVEDGLRSDIRTAPLRIQNPTARFVPSTDTLLISEQSDNEISFADESEKADEWTWDFGNGYGSTVREPTTFYDTAGLYSVLQVVRNQYGCNDSSTLELLVALHGDSPVMSDRQVCKGDTVHFRASNTESIKVYTGPDMQTVLYEGAVFVSGEISRDTIFYVTNTGQVFESLPVAVHIFAKAPQTGFTYSLDTANMNIKYALRLESEHPGESQVRWYLDGALAGTEHVASCDYKGKELFYIYQVLEDPEGCADSLRKQVQTNISPVPSMDGLVLCRGESAILEPGSGQLFYFYDDPSLTLPIHKGRRLSLSPPTQSTTVYVTCMDELREGPSIAVPIDLSGLEADITATPDTLNLQYGTEATLANSSSGASWSYWRFDSGVIDHAPVLYESYTNTGVYHYELVAGDDHQCVDTVRKSVVVLNITGLQDAEETVLAVYPNPASGYVRFRLPALPAGIPGVVVRNLLGKTVYRGNADYNGLGILTLDVDRYSKGVYLIEISAEDLVYFGRFVKQ